MDTNTSSEKEDKQAKVELLDEYRTQIKSWVWVPDGFSRSRVMYKAYREDRAEMTKGLKLLEQGKEREGWDVIQYMDTILRDLVPDDLYFYLQEKFDV